MSFNLVESAKGLFNNELVSGASNFLGESETSISKAVTGVVPTILSGLINKTTTHEGIAAITEQVNEQHDSGILNKLGGFLGNDGSLLNKGTGLLSNLFGNKLSGIVSLISNFSGIKSSSATSLLSMALPAVLGLIGKHASSTGTSVAAVLNSQKILLLQQCHLA
ncbi:MAG: DUF937 domain-containing protein [Ferruginibacter sp.]